MVETYEMQEIRGLDIDKLAKGFAEESYIFKDVCQVSSTSADQVRWYQKTAGTLTPTSPSAISNTAVLAQPETLEPSWTRNTSYIKEFKVETFISDRDIKTSDLDVLAGAVRDLTLAITKAVDTHIWDVMSESRSPSNIQSFATTAIGGDQWDAAAYAADPVKDLLHAKKLIYDYNYNPEGASLLLHPNGYKALVAWLISGKGSSIPGFSSEKISNGKVMEILGLRVRVSNNVTDDYAMVVVDKRATTFKQLTPISSVVIDDPQLGKKIRVKEEGVAYNTDPKAIVLITDINS